VLDVGAARPFTCEPRTVIGCLIVEANTITNASSPTYLHASG